MTGKHFFEEKRQNPTCLLLFNPDGFTKVGLKCTKGAEKDNDNPLVETKLKCEVDGDTQSLR